MKTDKLLVDTHVDVKKLISPCLFSNVLCSDYIFFSVWPNELITHIVKFSWEYLVMYMRHAECIVGSELLL